MTYLPTFSIQTQYFLYSILLGCLIGVIYDLLRLVREYVRLFVDKPKFYFSDVLIFIISAFIFEIYTISFGYGKVRYYALLGAILGFIFYINTVGIITFGLEKKSVLIFYEIFSKIILKPLNFFVKVLKKVKCLLYNKCNVLRKKFFRRKKGDEFEKEED